MFGADPKKLCANLALKTKPIVPATILHQKWARLFDQPVHASILSAVSNFVGSSLI